MRFSPRRSSLVIAAAASITANVSAADPGMVPEDWFPFTAKNDPAPGAIGMQDWLDKPAGKHGVLRMEGDHFVFADKTPVKFWGVNLGNLSCAPEPGPGKKWAEHYAKYGINAVRLHKFLPDIMVKESSTRFQPSLVDHLDTFANELRQRGIYYGFSWIFEHKVRPDDKQKLRHYDELVAAGGETSRVPIFIADDVQDLRIEMFTNLLNHRNPKTGLTYAKDPALAFVEFQNEDSIFFFTFGTFNKLDVLPSYKKEFLKKFAVWLKARYGSHQGLVKAWGTKAMNVYGIADENLDRGNVMVQGSPWFYSPEGLKQAAGIGTTQRLLDTARFLYEVQSALYAKFEKAVRGTGYQGPIVASCWNTPPGLPRYYNLETDAKIGIIDRHNYFGGLGGFAAKPGKFGAGSQLGAPGTGLISEGFLQVENRPYQFSEWNTVLPNQWAPESLTIVAAYGMGLQGWDGSYQFASHVRGQDPKTGFSSKLDEPRIWNVDVPNQVGIYPAITRMIYRGDVQEGSVVSTRNVAINELQKSVPEWMNQESAKVSEGLGDIKEQSGAIPPETLAVGRVVVAFTGNKANVETRDLSRYAKGNVVESTTGQLHWTKLPEKRGWISINTPGTQGVVGFHTGDKVELGDVTITPEQKFSAIYVSAAARNETLANARRALVTVAARVRNTGMKFNAEENELLELGAGPIMVEPVRASVVFKRPVTKVEVLNHDGLPTGTTLPVKDNTLTIDGTRDKALYYNVTFR